MPEQTGAMGNKNLRYMYRTKFVLEFALAYVTVLKFQQNFVNLIVNESEKKRCDYIIELHTLPVILPSLSSGK